MSVAMASHDRLGEFLLLLESTNGRDKLCRLIQFSAKYLKWKEETSNERDEKRVQVPPPHSRTHCIHHRVLLSPTAALCLCVLPLPLLSLLAVDVGQCVGVHVDGA